MLLKLIQSNSKYGNCNYVIFITGCFYESGRTYRKGISKTSARPILKGFQKSGQTYLNVISKKRPDLYLKGIQKSGRTYLNGIFKKAAYIGFITPKGVKAKRFLLY